MTKFIGIHAVFTYFDVWFIGLVLLFGTDRAIWLFREKFEGLGYQTSYSAHFGDAFIFGAVLLAATLLQRKGVYVPEWLQSGRTQFIILVVCVGLGIFVSWATLGQRSGQVGDIYHDVVVAPLILFFTITLLPVLWYNVIWYNGRWYEGLAVIFAVLAWAWLVKVDVDNKHMDQRSDLNRRFEHGFVLKDSVPATLKPFFRIRSQ